MSISGDLYAAAEQFLDGFDVQPLIEIKADMRDDGPQWFSVLVWDGQPGFLPGEEEDGAGGSDFRGLTVIAAGSDSSMDGALGVALSVLHKRMEVKE